MSKSRILLGGLAGLVSGAAAVAVGEAVAAVLQGVTSPFFSVGNRAVDAAPRPVKEWAIETFGTADKPVLLGGVALTVALLAVLAGVVGLSRPRVAIGAFLALTGVATAAALTDRAATAGPLVQLLPALAMIVTGLVSLVVLLRQLDAPGLGTSGGDGDGSQRAASAPDESDEPRPNRRAFLLAAGAVAAVAAAGGVVARAFGDLAAAASRAALSLRAPDRPAPPIPEGVLLDVDGITPYISSNKDFYRVDTALQVPDVPIEGWRLRIHGMVDNELSLSFDDLLARNLVESRITLTCVSNPVGGDLVDNATWLGVPMNELLREAGVQAGADAVKSTSEDGFTAGTPLEALLDEERGALVAVGMNGEPLPLDHGFPARMVTPGLYGYVSATKWLVDLEVTRFADFKAYWTTRGYAAQAPIKISSRIDVPGSFAALEPGPTTVAGVAWSQDRGIAGVEVRVDGGAWQQATLAEEDNIDTWRQWRWEWDATSGNHSLEVRATDRTGTVQAGERAPIAPDGATGWHSVTVQVG